MTLVRFVLSVSLAVVLAASPAGAQLRPEAPTASLPDHAAQEPHPGLYVAGAITTFASWLLAAGFGAFTYEDQGDEVALGLLLVPVAGPFVQVTREDHAADGVFVAVLGGLEIVGLTLCIVSNFITRPVRNGRLSFDGRALSVRF
jgi:hypothetical protein